MKTNKFKLEKFSKSYNGLTGDQLFTQLVAKNFNHKEATLKKMINIRDQWLYFIKNGSVQNPQIIRKEVLNSWQRCFKNGVDPTSFYDHFLSKADLKVRQQENQNILNAANPLLKAMAHNIKGSGFRIDLYDKDQVLIAQHGDPAVLANSKKFGSSLGVYREESFSGTNASSLVLLHNKPFQLVGPEHYKEFLHYWTCSAAPIYNNQQQIIAVINIAGPSGLIHQHTLGLAIFLARAVEQNLQQQQLTNQLKANQKFTMNIIDSIGEGLICVDNNNFITLLNQEGANLLGYSNQKYVNQSLDDVFGPNNPFTLAKSINRPFIDREISLNVNGKRHFFVGKTKVIANPDGDKNLIGVFRNTKTLKGFVKNFTGFQAHFNFSDLIGKNPQYLNAINLAKQTAKTHSNILLQGESGTGKDLFAQSIHNASNQRSGPFVAINCAAIPLELVESELFGYEGGAFTGAKKEGRPGKFELGDSGTIFLDEISSMPLNMQAKLLRVLENKTIMRVGGLTEIPFDARIIVASNQDLLAAVKQGKFREDLFFRINIIHINIPPLRRRLEDIPLLINHFCHKLSINFNQSITCSNRAINYLINLEWKGNIRELENTLERSALMALSRESGTIEKQDITHYNTFQERDFAKGKVLKNNEQETIHNVLKSTKGNISKTAKILGIARNTLYNKLKKHKINVQSFK